MLRSDRPLPVTAQLPLPTGAKQNGIRVGAGNCVDIDRWHIWWMLSLPRLRHNAARQTPTECIRPTGTLEPNHRHSNIGYSENQVYTSQYQICRNVLIF